MSPPENVTVAESDLLWKILYGDGSELRRTIRAFNAHTLCGKAGDFFFFSRIVWPAVNGPEWNVMTGADCGCGDRFTQKGFLRQLISIETSLCVSQSV